MVLMARPVEHRVAAACGSRLGAMQVFGAAINMQTDVVITSCTEKVSGRACVGWSKDSMSRHTERKCYKMGAIARGACDRILEMFTRRAPNDEVRRAIKINIRHRLARSLVLLVPWTALQICDNSAQCYCPN